MPERKQAAWGVLIYLAGDVEQGHEAIRDDLDEILRAGASEDFRIAVQYDGPGGGERYLLASRVPPEGHAAIRIGRVDSGSAEALFSFLQWGISQCHADRLALVFGSPIAVGVIDSAQTGNERVFPVSHDKGSGRFLDASDLAQIIRDALDDGERRQLDLFAIDSCQVQFLELACELEGLVRVLIAPQTEIPLSGWDYERVLNRWQELAGGWRSSGTRELARELLGEIIGCYGSSAAPDAGAIAVSALDLDRLDEVARSFDTLCMGTLQCLGEGLIWQARQLALDHVKRKDNAPVYDCGSFFMLWGASLQALADEAYQGWLATALNRTRGAGLDRFFDAVARHLEALDDAGNDAGEARITSIIDALRSAPERRNAAGGRLLDVLGQGIRARMRAPAEVLAQAPAEASPNAAPLAEAHPAGRQSSGWHPAVRDLMVAEAIKGRAFHLLPQERQFDLRRMEEAAQSARRLAQQAQQAADALLGGGDGAAPGMVIALRNSADEEHGWPRWSGVSLYRPNRLDDLTNSAYQRFAFHRRVHWAAMLGAANLIEEHPRALWRLVSSLLSTGAAGTRRDVLRRLTGADSVVWGLREQFRAMAPAPTLTLSLEQRSIPYGATTRENYLLRLESISRGAVVTEQESRVQPRVMDRALRGLDALLRRDSLDAAAFAELRSIGGLLGEDIFQSLGRALEDEREAARAENPDATAHLQLQIPRDLMRYPWELLHRRGEWLGERYAMGRQVYMQTGVARRVPGRRQGRIRPLIVGDPVFDADLKWRQLPGARDEAEQVAGWFEQMCREAGSSIEFDRKRDTRIHCRVTGAEMRALLRDGGYDIVHFAGHGLFRSDDPETSAWLMSDGELWSLEIRNTLAEQASPPWLVFANACEAGMDAQVAQRSYHSNVFGLATAFINQGVAAYIAPLWPIDDLLAQYLAREFYRHLLCERATLGEALRRAKAGARRVAYGTNDITPSDPNAVWAGLGWASLVLYGDPTEELFQALAGGPSPHPESLRRSWAASPAAAARPASEERRWSSGAGRPAIPFAPSFMHAPDHVVTQWVCGPRWNLVTGASQRTGHPLPDGAVALELIDDGGLRRWRVRSAGTGAAGTRGDGAPSDALPGSRIAALMADERLTRELPVKRGTLRVIGRWIVSGFDDGVGGLVREYDREQVKSEGLLAVNGAGASDPRPLSRDALASPGAAPRRRALVLLHGTFSKTASPVEGLGAEFIEWARTRYSVVLGLDHWTLSRTPEENAQLLEQQLQALDPALMTRGAIDLVCHSRGGLVARAFCDLLGHADAVRNLVFVGTPNCGTDLANPNNWGTFADLLVNLTGIANAEPLGRMAGLLARLAVRELADKIVDDVPGLLAQNPASTSDEKGFLARLQKAGIDRSKIRYGIVCAEFEPVALVPNLKKLLQKAAASGADAVADALFRDANDLVVNTAHAWRIGPLLDGAAPLPDFIEPERVLVYRPPNTEFVVPEKVVVETALGVHHCNLFRQRRVRESIKDWLSQ